MDDLFDKMFFPSEEEKAEQQKFLEDLEKKNKDFWLQQGLTDKQYSLLKTIEEAELSLLNPYEEYFSRRIMIEDGFLTISEVLQTINKYETASQINWVDEEDNSYDYYDIEESLDGKFYLMNRVDNYYCYDKSELIKGVFEDREFAELVADLLNKDHGEGYEGRR